jgi:hypothetical protein
VTYFLGKAGGPMKRMKQFNGWIGSALAATLCLVVIDHASAGGMLPSDAVVDGKTIGQWTADWWDWVGSFPVTASPLVDSTGELQNINQPGGSVFLVGGSPYLVAGSSAVATRSVDVPGNRHLLVPLVYLSITSSVGDPPEMIECMMTQLANDVASLTLSIDGTNLPQEVLFAGRYEGNFRDAFPGFTLNEGTDTVTYTAGFWSMLEPLAHGQHTLVFGGAGTIFSAEDAPYGLIADACADSSSFCWPDHDAPYGMMVTAHITVSPEPCVGSLVAAAGLTILMRRRRWRAIATIFRDR